MFSRISVLFLCIGYLYSCANYPTYKLYRNGVIIQNNYSFVDSTRIIEFDLVAVQSKSSIKTKVLDTLQLELEGSFDTPNYVGIIQREQKEKKEESPITRSLKLPYKEATQNFLDSLIKDAKIVYDRNNLTSKLKLPFKKSVPSYLKSLEINGNGIVFFPTYRYSFSDVREGGGGIEIPYKTGYQRHNVTHELYVAIYLNSQLIYSNNAVRFEQITTKKGESIKHEFPEGIADTLMNKALRDYVERLE
jgi:hypothetical protein